MPLSPNSSLDEVVQVVQLLRLRPERCAGCLPLNMLIGSLPDEAETRKIKTQYLREPLAKLLGQCAAGYTYHKTSDSRKGTCTNPVFNNHQSDDPTAAAMEGILNEANAAQNDGKGE